MRACPLLIVVSRGGGSSLRQRGKERFSRDRAGQAPGSGACWRLAIENSARVISTSEPRPCRRAHLPRPQFSTPCRELLGQRQGHGASPTEVGAAPSLPPSLISAPQEPARPKPGRLTAKHFTKTFRHHPSTTHRSFWRWVLKPKLGELQGTVPRLAEAIPASNSVHIHFIGTAFKVLTSRHSGLGWESG